KGYHYLRKHAAWMQYAQYRRQGLPLGSGVTEAACKTVFAERLKRSGMTWGRAGGQVIVDLRILVVSDVWQQTHEAYLASRPHPTIAKQAIEGLGQAQALPVAAESQGRERRHPSAAVCNRVSILSMYAIRVGDSTKVSLQRTWTGRM